MKPGPTSSQAEGRVTSGALRARRPAAEAASRPKAASKTRPGAEGAGATARAASDLIDERIRSLDDWRGETLAGVRCLIHEADPEITEECKWIKPSNPLGVTVWSPRPYDLRDPTEGTCRPESAPAWA